MSKDIKYCYDDEDLEHVAENMGDLQVRRLPVVNRDKRLVGIVALGDVARHEDHHTTGETTAERVKAGRQASSSKFLIALAAALVAACATTEKRAKAGTGRPTTTSCGRGASRSAAASSPTARKSTWLSRLPSTTVGLASASAPVCTGAAAASVLAWGFRLAAGPFRRRRPASGL